MDQPFFEIYTRNMIKGDTIVFWGLRRGFNDTGPYMYTLQWAESINAEWVTVDTGALIDTYWATDPTQRLWAKELESYYRLILTTNEGTYISFPQQASGLWNKKEWLIARDISRKELLRLEKQVGVQGYLLKRKIWGPACTCVDWDNDTESTNTSCTLCYGTGIDGGYWPPFPTYMDSDLIPRNKEHDDNVGTKEDMATKARMLGYPHVSTYDVYVDGKTDRRWVFRKVDNVAELRGQPLVYSAEIRLAPFTDPIYNFPLFPPTPSSSSIVPSSSSSSMIPSFSSSSISSSSSVMSSSSLSSISSSSSSNVLPPQPPFPPGIWIWYDEQSQMWVLGEIGSYNAWYRSQYEVSRYWPYIPTYDWFTLQGTPPVPDFTTIDGSQILVDGAGTYWLDGLYSQAGVWNGAYAFQGSPVSPSSSSSSSSLFSSSSSSSPAP